MDIDALTAPTYKLLDSAIAVQSRKLSVYKDRIELCRRQITHIIEEYRDTGIVYVSAPAAENFTGLVTGDVEKFFRELVKEKLGKLFVYAEQHSYGEFSYIHLRVPNNKRTTNVVAGLMLVAEGGVFEHWPKMNWRAARILDKFSSALIKVDTGGTWHFAFLREAGAELFEAFLEQARTNPVFKVILR